MRFVAALGGIPFVLVCLVIGPRLLLLARRTRALPELVMGSSLLLMGGIGYPLTSVARQAAPLSDSARTGFMIAAHVCMVTGAFSMAVFNWRVFRADARWARRLTLGTALVLAALFAAQGVSPGFEAGALRGDGLPLVLINLVVAANSCWSMVESLAYRRKLALRRRLGLGDPLVEDRLRLWAAAMGGAAAISLWTTWLHALGVDPAASAAGALVIGPFGLASATAVALAFFPPAGYRRRVLARAAA
jgi:hypothetical protein